ncbi:putative signal peptidase complex subunit 2 [Trichoplax sp. H2]|nr:putative signal peptidase complex subunit 2 [Trichoplax sp. H2]|eukprot:RDD43895.1 putative signal peptidase complex subunit 2 [Trichoplax sp. H2]
MLYSTSRTIFNFSQSIKSCSSLNSVVFTMAPAQEDSSKIVKTNKWNQSRVKTSIDDAIRTVVIDRMGLQENYKFLDIRLYICLMACVIAGIATSYDYLNPFPKSKMVLIVCCLLYFVCVSILTWFMTYVEKQVFLNAIGKDAAGIDPDSYWQFSSSMEKNDKNYKLTIILYNGKNNCNIESSLIKSVEDWIDENDFVLIDEIEKVIKRNMDKSMAPSKKD